MRSRREGPAVLDLAAGLGATATPGSEDIDQPQETDEWLERARGCYRESTDWFDQVIRPQVNRNIAHFKSRHAPGSKYLHPHFRARSSIFRPKTRSLIRRTEAAVAVALFSTSDLLTITPWADRDPIAQQSARIAQMVMQHRLEETIPWFLTTTGAAQDAAVSGVVISHQYWNYRTTVENGIELTVDEETGAVSAEEVTTKKVLKNQPECDIVPLENFRLSPASDWRDPVNSSPYVIHSVPTFVGDLRELIDEHGMNDILDESRIWAAAENDYDSIRTARESVAVEKYANNGPVEDARVIWVRKHIHRIAGIDYYFETVNDMMMLREPEPLALAFPHIRRIAEKRPYQFGWTVLETHKAYKDSQTELVDELQQEANDVVNLRLDQAKNAMFGRWKVLRGRNVDTQTLLAGIPQSIIAMDSMESVQELRQSDVGQGAFASEDRINTDFDEVSGNFSLASIASNRQMNETVGGMNLLSGDASQVKEYEIRMLVETWVEPVLRQLLALEAEYEDDAEVLGFVAAATGVTPAEVQDALARPAKLRTNVGFGATSPEKRIGKLMLGLNAMKSAGEAAQVLPGLNMTEISSEVFGALGYADGSRFVSNGKDEDPEKAQLRAQVQQLMQMVQGKGMELQSRERIAQSTNESRERIATMSARVQWQLGLLGHGIATKQAQLAEVDRMLAAEGNEIKRGELRLQREALSHEINESNKEVQRVMRENKDMKGQQKGQQSGKDKGPPKLEGDDKAGVVARDRYGEVPFAQG